MTNRKTIITAEGLLGRFYEIRVEGLERMIHFKAERLSGATLIGHDCEHQQMMIQAHKIREIRRQGVEFDLIVPRRRRPRQ